MDGHGKQINIVQTISIHNVSIRGKNITSEIVTETCMFNLVPTHSAYMYMAVSFEVDPYLQ
jgi:hypothetical protein